MKLCSANFNLNYEKPKLTHDILKIYYPRTNKRRSNPFLLWTDCYFILQSFNSYLYKSYSTFIRMVYIHICLSTLLCKFIYNTDENLKGYWHLLMIVTSINNIHYARFSYFLTFILLYIKLNIHKKSLGTMPFLYM